MKKIKAAALILCLALVVGLVPSLAFAEDEETYVLMNIPYGKFFEAELEGKGEADAVSAATKMKRSNGGLAGGSYHVGAEGEGISGVVFPVLVKDASVLDASKEITDASSIDVTTTARGNTSTTTYSGSEALFEAPDYSWYKLSEKPAVYKELSAGADGFSFGAAVGEPKTVEGVTAAITYNGRHTDLEIVLSGEGLPAAGDKIGGVIVTTEDGRQYGLGHVTNVWRATQLGWDADDVTKTGKAPLKITNVRYINIDGIKDFPVDIQIEARGEAGFTDIAGDEWYAAAAAWAVEKGYISNRGDGKFAEDSELTRADVVTYMWNAAGKPEPAAAENPFSDIADTDSFYKAVLWAKEAGITDGTGDGKFSPAAKLDRATVLAFIWKQAGKPEAKTASEFSDVAEGDWFKQAVDWGVEKKITEGTGEGQFSPKAPVTLGHTVTFLYRNAAE